MSRIQPLSHKIFHIGLSLSLALVIILAQGCKSKRNTTHEITVKNTLAKDIVDSLMSSYCAYNWLNAKASTQLIFNTNENDVKSNIKMRTDSATWISLTKMGVPAFVGLISKDSVKLLTKVGAKQYFMDDFQKINELFDAEIDYSILEDYFKGLPIAFDSEEEYILSSDTGHYLLSSEKSKRINKMLKKSKSKGDELLYRCWIDPVTFKCTRVIINLISDNVTLEVNYGNWVQSSGCLFPMFSTLEINSNDTRIFLKMEYSKVELDIEQTMPFNYTDSYIKIELKDLVGE
jgi:hypothetical protein